MWITVLTAVATVTGIALVAGLALGYASRKLPASSEPLVDRVDEMLPQTQCAQCGYPGCRPYAEAIFEGRAEINRCPPGGDATVRRLARALGRPELPPLDTSGGHASLERVARIDEARCVGCGLCRRACPVDAIVGLPHMMHTVLARHCTGCELCVPACPVDCIDMVRRHD